MKYLLLLFSFFLFPFFSCFAYSTNYSPSDMADACKSYSDPNFCLSILSSNCQGCIRGFVAPQQTALSGTASIIGAVSQLAGAIMPAAAVMHQANAQVDMMKQWAGAYQGTITSLGNNAQNSYYNCLKQGYRPFLNYHEQNAPVALKPQEAAGVMGMCNQVAFGTLSGMSGLLNNGFGGIGNSMMSNGMNAQFLARMMGPSAGSYAGIGGNGMMVPGMMNMGAGFGGGINLNGGLNLNLGLGGGIGAAAMGMGGIGGNFNSFGPMNTPYANTNLGLLAGANGMAPGPIGMGNMMGIGIGGNMGFNNAQSLQQQQMLQMQQMQQQQQMQAQMQMQQQMQQQMAAQAYARSISEHNARSLQAHMNVAVPAATQQYNATIGSVQGAATMLQQQQYNQQMQSQQASYYNSFPGVAQQSSFGINANFNAGLNFGFRSGF